MLMMIKHILNYMRQSDSHKWKWSRNSVSWDYFRSEYKNEAQAAYEYWNVTGKLNYTD